MAKFSVNERQFSVRDHDAICEIIMSDRGAWQTNPKNLPRGVIRAHDKWESDYGNPGALLETRLHIDDADRPFAVRFIHQNTDSGYRGSSSYSDAIFRLTGGYIGAAI